MRSSTSTLAFFLVLSGIAPSMLAEAFQLAIEETAVYGVSYEELAASGLEGAVASEGLGLSSGGRPVPLWIAEGDDGAFGPGDHLEFVGLRLEGESGHFNEFSRFNIYRLETEGGGPRITRGPELPTVDCPDAGSVGRQHLEEDTLRVRFPPTGVSRPEIWYWARLTHADKKAFETTLALDDLELDADQLVHMRLHFKGWSSVPNKAEEITADHQIELWLGEHLLGRREWDNTSVGYLFDGVELTARELAAAGATLKLKVPPRRGVDGPVIDASLLNWIEIEYPRKAEVTSDQTLLWPREGSDSVCLVPAVDTPALVFAADGRRYEIPGGEGRRIPPGSGDDRSPPHVATGALRTVANVERDSPSQLSEVDHQADYLVIAHPSLLPAAEELARYHRGRGLTVTLVDVTDVYDEFNHGIVHPRAIKSFLTHAYRSWRQPKPRFVLLVGDASWDLSDEPADDSNYANMSFELATTFGVRRGRSTGDFKFRRRQVTTYDETAPAVWRNLIPAWDRRTIDGPAASDNWFVDVDGDDLRPEMAIGRFPVATSEEVLAIVEKTIATIDWAESRSRIERHALLVTDHYPASASHADSISGLLQAAGFEATKIYPDADPTAGQDHPASLVEAFDRGPDLVYFVGHGGRFEWRTGRPDLANQTDLFTLDHVDTLAEQPARPLPLVLSVACYSAPFDHPNADSIGEKLLRAPEKGAVAVVAAAWRITPSVATGEALVDQLLVSPTLGEALRTVKTTSTDFQFVVQFNLLGDPALPLAGWLYPREEPMSASAPRAQSDPAQR